MITAPYNHYDSHDGRVILDVKPRQLPLSFSYPAGTKKARISIPTANAHPIILELCSDSPHLIKFFSANWPADNSAIEPHARIMALKGSAGDYGLSDDFNNYRWFCSKSRQVWMFGTEYYLNIKITIRGLCSELAPFEEMFLHGCSVSIEDQGVVIAGTAGAGKTTLTSALRQRLGCKLRFVNEDWGPFSLTTGVLKSTEQPLLYIKYSDVRSIASELRVTPNTHLSDNLADDGSGRQAHALVSPAELFGGDHLQSRVTLKLFVIVIRDLAQPASYRYLSPEDVSVIENGQYLGSKSNDNWFLNRPLFLIDEMRRSRTRKQHETLLARFSCVALNNSADPVVGANIILSVLEDLADRTSRSSSPIPESDRKSPS